MGRIISVFFGSVAWVDDNEWSDIDFIIDYNLSKITPWFPSGLMQDLQFILGRKVDIVSKNEVQSLPF